MGSPGCLGERPRIKEIHLGGGTPTFFSPENLDRLTGIMDKADRTENYEFSFEARNTSKAHLDKLYELGFRRNSFGVQDYDPLVQKTINRIQSFDQVKEVTDQRGVGYTSISHDLVFGLPHQTLDGIADSIEKTAQLMPRESLTAMRTCLG